ncbi:transcription termination factor MTERF6, chloroplastic/mitochondrial-like [Prosopis cineraria]|uniref:transcription termination factor MTERF6, chloroplastic/mitochondrial-like n=1 Tax=Prosopis cineraria TaxID=364024 RepID=UPI00240F3E6F|nr:transcription termination factor MTERF6, chloroplastic/mitochondrial-like [Prosopis cineraria]
MFCFLRKLIPSRRHFINTASPSTFQQLLCVENPSLPATARYCNSITFNAHSFTVSYLIDTCGFSPDQAVSASKYVNFQTREKPDLVINFQKNLGFTKSQILRFTSEVPQLLRSDPEKTLLPKIEFFISRGVSSSDIPRLLCSCPNVMRRSLDQQLIPSFDFLGDLFQSDDKLIKALTCFSGILLDVNARAVPNMKLLREVGVPESNVRKLLEWYPRTLTKNTGKFKMIVEELKEMGFDPLKFQFIMAIYALSSLSKSTWSKKADVYKKWGWSGDDIIAAFRRCPSCMKASEDKIDAIMGFLVYQLGCPPSIITKHAVVLSLSLNKRIVPRGSVFQVLLSKGLVKKERWIKLFIYTEREFLDRFILCHEEEASELLKLYQSKLGLA